MTADPSLVWSDMQRHWFDCFYKEGINIISTSFPPYDRLFHSFHLQFLLPSWYFLTWNKDVVMLKDTSVYHPTWSSNLKKKEIER